MLEGMSCTTRVPESVCTSLLPPPIYFGKYRLQPYCAMLRWRVQHANYCSQSHYSLLEPQLFVVQSTIQEEQAAEQESEYSAELQQLRTKLKEANAQVKRYAMSKGQVVPCCATPALVRIAPYLCP